MIFPRRSVFALICFFFCYTTPIDAQWTKIDGQGGSSVTSFASWGDSLFAATNGGVIKSGDNGQTWQSFNRGLTDSEVTSIAVFNSTLLVSSYYSGISKWNAIDSSWNRSSTIGYVNSFTELGPFLFATGDQGVALSSDGGSAWQTLNDTFASNCCIAVSTVLLAGTDDGIYSSLDFGSTWTPASDSSLIGYTVFSMVSLGENLFACAVSNGNRHISGIYRSTDQGATWSLLFKDSISVTGCLFVHASELYAASMNSVYRSTDSGINWRNISGDLATQYVDNVIVQNGNLFISTSNEGIYRSTNSGIHWDPVNLALGGSLVSILSADSVLFLGEAVFQQGIICSSDQGKTWYPVDFDSVRDQIETFGYVDNVLFMEAIVGVNGPDIIYRSTTGGLTWDSVTNGFATSFACLGSNIFAGTEEEGVLHSTDSGKTWTTHGSLIGGDSLIYCMATIGDKLFVVTDNGLYRSIDEGASWTHIPGALSNGSVDCLAVMGNILYAASFQGIFRSTDYGNNWIQIDSNLGWSVNSFSFATCGTNIFIGISSGIYCSTDSGNSWQNISGNLDFSREVYPQLTTDNQYLYILMYYDGPVGTSVWRRPLSDMNPQSFVMAIPVTIPSFQSYPNPFSHSTTISVTVPESGYSEISVENLLGVEVGKVYSGELDAGTRSFEWNPSNLPNGVYECRIQVNGLTRSIPLVLSK